MLQIENIQGYNKDKDNNIATATISTWRLVQNFSATLALSESRPI